MDSLLTQSNPANLQLFQKQYEKLAGKVYLANNAKQAVQFIDAIFAGAKVTKVVTAPLPEDISRQLEKFFQKTNIPAVELDLKNPDIQNQISKAEVGISAAEFAIAAMGAMVEVTTEDSYRLVSSLPRVHIAFLKASEIIDDLDDAAPRLRNIYNRHKSNCNITFISGPSRTADIEMKLFLGVHGPQESHVIICDWQQ